MKAIFIGGPLHGQIKQVESSHEHVAWMPPRTAVFDTEISSEIVRYRRQVIFGQAAIFTALSPGTDQQLIETVERGLQVSSEPTVRRTIEILFRLNAGHLFFQAAEDKPSNIEFLTDLVKSYWDKQLKFKTVK